jgi:hypothetical protein
VQQEKQGLFVYLESKEHLDISSAWRTSTGRRSMLKRGPKQR